MGKHKTLTGSCLNCGTAFEVRVTDFINGGGGDFCSRSCSNSGQYNPRYRGGQLSNYEYKLRAMQKNPQRFRAMQIIHTAIRNGTLVRAVCEICANPKSEAHHENYDKPLEVQWLCRRHHNEAHNRGDYALDKQ